MPVHALHPLLQRNTSDFFAQRFSSSFTGREFFLADHRIQGQRILPGVAYLEMARAAAALANGGLTTGMRLRDVVWIRPFVAVEALSTWAGAGYAGPNQLHIGLSRADDGTVNYEIYGQPERPGDESPLYSRGCVVIVPQDNCAEAPRLDLATLRQQCARRTLNADECYQAFKSAGLDYGPGHQGIETLFIGSDQVLAQLRLPAAVVHSRDRYVLHPSLMDAALQAVIGLMDPAQSGDAVQTSAGAGARLALPFALDELEMFASCPATMWAVVRYSVGSGPNGNLPKLDIDLCDDQGHCCVSLRGLSCRVHRNARPTSSHLGTLMITPAWRVTDRDDAPAAPTFSRHMVIFCEPHGLSYGDLADRMAGTDMTYRVSNAVGEGIPARFQAHLTLVFAEVQAILRARAPGPALVQVVVPGMVEEQRLFGAISALLKTAHLEHPTFIGQVIEVRDDFAAWCDGLVAKLLGNRQRCHDSHVLYRDGTRLVAAWEPLATLSAGEAQEALPRPWKDGGVYLISGGAGGLGRLFVAEIARWTRRATVILVGRSPLAGERRERLEDMRARFPQATIDYRQADVADAEAVTELVQWIRRTFGNLHALIHAAGVLHDNYLLKKSSDELHAVLAPKVAGLVNLDHASQDCDLDYLVLCSSGSAAEGNGGQADYTAANAFMDAYAVYRNALADTGQRRGRTMSVNWPLWQEGGMRADQQTEELLL
jgi:NAD(P)-dependent dehydrogenase (short-subunit alcohol dehydrogenase family)